MAVRGGAGARAGVPHRAGDEGGRGLGKRRRLRRHAAAGRLGDWIGGGLVEERRWPEMAEAGRGSCG
jgi:hypothetical protein